MGRRVECEIEHITLKSSRGKDVDSVRAICPECGHSTESFGTGPGSVKRCLVLLSEECPEGEDNFYVEEGSDE